jgi:uncharacterized membrane protein
MHDLLALTFNDLSAAKGAREALRKLQHEHLLVLEDAAVLMCDANGKVHVHNELTREVKQGAGIGAMIGLLVGFLFPVLGIVVGTVGGAIYGATTDHSIEKSFVESVKSALKPGTSAILLVVEKFDKSALETALAPFHGTIFSTTLHGSFVEQLRKASSK